MMISVILIKDFVWQYILPYICLLAFLFNLINIIVFSSKKLENPVSKYLLCHSMFECVYALLSFAYFFTKHVIQVPSCSYLVNFMEFYFIQLMTTSIAIFLIIIEILIALNRLLVIFYSKITNKLNFNLTSMIILFTFSVFSQYPVYLSRSIKLNANFTSSSINYCQRNESYEIRPSAFMTSTTYKLIYSIVSYLRGLLAPLALLVINTLICMKFRAHLKKKMTLTRSQSDHRGIFSLF